MTCTCVESTARRIVPRGWSVSFVGCPLNPLLLAGHGTRSQDGAAAFDQFTETARRPPGPARILVAAGFMLSAPPLTDAVCGLHAAGHNTRLDRLLGGVILGAGAVEVTAALGGPAAASLAGLRGTN